MTALVRVLGVEATLRAGKWKSDDADVETLLNLHLNALGPLGSDPNYDLNEATRIAEQLGGEVVSYDKTEYEEGVIY